MSSLYQYLSEATPSEIAAALPLKRPAIASKARWGHSMPAREGGERFATGSPRFAMASQKPPRETLPPVARVPYVPNPKLSRTIGLPVCIPPELDAPWRLGVLAVKPNTGGAR